MGSLGAGHSCSSSNVPAEETTFDTNFQTCCMGDMYHVIVSNASVKGKQGSCEAINALLLPLFSMVGKTSGIPIRQKGTLERILNPSSVGLQLSPKDP